MAKVMKNGGKACLRASHRQAVTVEDLKKAGVPIMTAKEYGIEKLIRMKPKGIEEARKILSKVKTSLSDDIIKAREEER